MTVKELYTKTFDEAVEELSQENENITSAESLKDYIKTVIDGDYLFLAAHLLKAMHDSPADYYGYDYCMGTLETPTPLKELSDLEDYCKEVLQ